MRSVRAEKITIDLPKPDSEAWVRIINQFLHLNDDGSVKSISGRESQLFRKMENVQTEVIQFQDPVTQQVTTASVAGIAAAIGALVTKWSLEDIEGARFDPVTQRVMID